MVSKIFIYEWTLSLLMGDKNLHQMDESSWEIWTSLKWTRKYTKKTREDAKKLQRCKISISIDQELTVDILIEEDHLSFLLKIFKKMKEI